MFKLTNGSGFHITFTNGNTVSVQWDAGHYCDNKNFITRVSDRRKISSRNAEVAAWDKDSNWFKLGISDTVIGYQTPEEVLAIMIKASKGEL